MSQQQPPPPTIPAPQQQFSEAASELLSTLQFYAQTVTEHLKTWTSDSVLTSWIVTAFCVVVTLLIVFLFVALGWYVVWICFLSRFRLLRELIGQSGGTPPQPSSPSQPQPQSKKRQKRKPHFE